MKMHSEYPFGWTAETLMGSHSSKPFDPDIANVFYRAGYIESWGRGIQKICDACKNLGADEPEYIVHGEDIMVKFCALQSAIVSDPKVPKHQSTEDFCKMGTGRSTYNIKPLRIHCFVQIVYIPRPELFKNCPIESRVDFHYNIKATCGVSTA